MATRTTDERDWLRRLGLGDEAAWIDLYRAHQGRIYRFAWHMCGIASVADEVTQETFLAFLKDHRRFDPQRGTLAAWLLGIARRQVLKALRGRRNEAELTDVGVEAVWDDGDVRTLRRMVLSLPEPYREAIVLCELQELSYEEAAKAMNCPLGTVRSRLSRARLMLTERMTRRPDGKSMRATGQISGTKEYLADNTE